MGKGRIGWLNGPDIRPFLGGAKAPTEKRKNTSIKTFFPKFWLRAQIWAKTPNTTSFWGWNSTDSSNLSRSCPGDVPEMSRSCPGDVPEMSRRCPGDVPEMSRRCPGFRFRRFVFFFCVFLRFWLFFFVFFVFCVLLCFLGFSPFWHWKNLSHSIPFAKFHLFWLFNQLIVFVVSQLFCVVLFFFMFFVPSLGGMGKQNVSLELAGFQILVHKMFSKIHTEAKTLAFSQIWADNRHEKYFSHTKMKCHTKGQHENRTYCRTDKACKVHSRQTCIVRQPSLQNRSWPTMAQNFWLTSQFWQSNKFSSQAHFVWMRVSSQIKHKHEDPWLTISMLGAWSEKRPQHTTCRRQTPNKKKTIKTSSWLNCKTNICRMRPNLEN